VPVGEDQVAHVEITREVARRFNHLYGREPGYEELCREAIRKLGKKAGKLFGDLRAAWLERGDRDALGTAREVVEKAKSITLGDRERLLGYLEGGGRQILTEPQALLTEAAKMPGLDGQKMSKSYNNTIGLRESPDAIAKKLRTMPTDPNRVRRTDKGDPDKCPVWPFHLVYSAEDVKQWANQGCRAASIGCLECKQPVIDAVLAELEPIQRRAAELANDLTLVRNVIAGGCRRAREAAEETLQDVRRSMGLEYS
jgi:tryptophanyl-tRNA synthetase